jgi:hypothetical protein
MASERSETPDRPFPISPALTETIGWAAGILGMTLAAAWIVVGPWDHDAGYFLQRGADIARGLRPYIDYRTIYPPLVDVITAFAVRTDASRLFLTIALPFAWILANTIVSGFLAWTVTRSRAVATLIAALFPLFTYENEGNHVTLEHGVALFTMLALAAVASETIPLTPRRLALCGVWIGAAILSKQNGVVALLPVGAILCSRRSEISGKAMAAFFAGLASIPLAILAWLGFDVAAVYRNVFGLLVNYAAGSAPLRHAGWRWEFVYAPWSAFLYVIAIAAGIALMIYVPRWRLLAGAGVLAGVIQALPRVIRDYRHYNINIWPFIVLLLALAAAQPNENRRVAIVAILLVFAPAATFWQLRHTFPSDSVLFRSFVPAGQAVAHATPANGAVRQYGAEPIIEFLAERREDSIDKGRQSQSVWDGSGFYGDVPPKETTVVVVDGGQSWVPSLVTSLRNWHFDEVARAGTRPSISVYRNRDAMKR